MSFTSYPLILVGAVLSMSQYVKDFLATQLRKLQIGNWLKNIQKKIKFYDGGKI